MNKRTFLKSLAGIPVAASPLIDSIDKWLSEKENVVNDGSFWKKYERNMSLKTITST